MQLDELMFHMYMPASSRDAGVAAVAVGPGLGDGLLEGGGEVGRMDRLSDGCLTVRAHSCIFGPDASRGITRGHTRRKERV